MSLLATFAANIILIGLGTVWWATSPYNVPVSLPGVTIEGRYTFTGTHIVAAVLAVAIAGLLYLLLYRTRIGKAMRAVASNREAAERRARGGIKRGLITLQKDRLSGGAAGREGSS